MTGQVEDIGNIVIQRSNGAIDMMKYKLCVSRIKFNLLIIGQLVEKGFLVVIKDEALELFDTQNNLGLKYLLSNNRTFKNMINLTKVQCQKTVVDHRSSWVWHLLF